MSGSPPALPRRRRHIRRRRWPWIVGLSAILLLLLLDAAWSGLGAATSLQDTRDDLRAGAASLESGDVAEAQNAFGAASNEATSAVNSLSHPGPRLLSMLPWIGDDVDAVRSLAGAAQLSSQAGVALANGAEAAGWDGNGIPGFAPGGRLDASVLQRAQPDLQRAADLLDQAREEVADVDPAALVGPLQDPAGKVKDEVESRASQADALAAAADVLPGMLGADGPRRYLLVSLNTSDPRGSSGYAGAYALLTVDGERLSIGGFRPTYTIPSVPPVDAPPETAKRWKGSGALSNFIDTTHPPDFPTAGMLMTEIWESAGREPVDGVIAADPYLMAALLRVLGPVDTPAWPQTITGSNVVEVLGADTFRATSSTDSDARQNAIGDALWTAVLTRPWPARAVASAFADAADQRHLFAYATDPEEQGSLERLGVAGQITFPPSPDPLVVYEGYLSSRAGYFAEFEETTDVEGMPSGAQRVTLDVTLHNTAPKSGPPSILLGLPTDPFPYGYFGAEVHVYMPPGSTVRSVRTDGRLPLLELTKEEFGRPVLVTTVQAKAQTSSTTTVVYEVPPTG